MMEGLMMYEQNNQWVDAANSFYRAGPWTRLDDKVFEHALVNFPDDGTHNRWRLIAGVLPGRSPEELMARYEALLHDLTEIESGRVELPAYSDDSSDWDSDSPPQGSNNQISFQSSEMSKRSKRRFKAEKQKGKPWSEDEHRLFLKGLEVYGKGDWRSIARLMVVSRTPTQVASHAQKYFLRQGASKKERKRSSIHDITDPKSTDTTNQGGVPVVFTNQVNFHIQG